jgi:hypothetical protein
MNESKPFWIVVQLNNSCKSFDAFKSMFLSYDSAANFASAKASASPGNAYFVMRATHAFKTAKPEVETKLLMDNDK